MPTPLPLVFDPPRRAMPPRHFADLDEAGRAAAVTDLGLPAFRGKQVANQYYGRLIADPHLMTDLPAAVRDQVADALFPRLLDAVRVGPVRAQAEILDEAMHWMGFTGLGGKEEALPAELNLHERKFLELARALAARPKLLLLDEVLSGLNPSEIDNAIRLVRAIRAQGATIVFVEHLMRAVVELSDRIAVLNEGKLFALGAPRDVMRDPRVVSIYLGKAYAA